MGHLSEVLGLWGLFTVIGWVTWVASNNRRRLAAAKTQAEMQAKLLDKLSSSQDLAEFLKTEPGQRLFDSAGMEPANPYRRILGSIQAGLILTLLGISMFFVSGKLADAEQGLTLTGTMATAVGVGFLLSSGISYTLSKSWGLFNRKDPMGR